MTVVIFGIGGGGFGTLFTSGFDVPIPTVWKAWMGEGHGKELLFHGFRNLGSGGFAAWANWILYTPIVEASGGRPVNEMVILGAIVSGGVGASLVAALLAGRAKDQQLSAQRQQLSTKEQAIENLNAVVEILTPGAPAVPEPEVEEPASQEAAP